MSFSDHILNINSHPLRNPFWRELEEEGTITFRDNYQFELKSEFFIDPNAEETKVTQEFYLFIPETLQINPQTYSAEQFYLDELSLIRFKTPYITLKDLIDTANYRSPIYRIQTCEDRELSLEEMMLFGNIFRTSLRFRVRKLLKNIRMLKDKELEAYVEEQVRLLIDEVGAARQTFSKTKNFLIGHFSQKRFVDQLNYIDEYISIVITEYLTLLLRVVREHKNMSLGTADAKLCEFIDQEAQYRLMHKLHPEEEGTRESILFRQGLLEKFMLSILKLKNTRVEIKQQYGNLIGALAAAVAMFVYMVLLVWNASTLVINSAPFVLLAVVFYVLKDRIKEGLKMLYNKYINRWFPDYRTNIYNPSGKIIGRLSESFLFINYNKLPHGFYNLRMRDAEDSLEFLQPTETIIQYKKEVTLYKSEGKLTELNTIFRYNIHRFLEKANDALQPTLKLDSDSHVLEERLLPKVYHLTLILKSDFHDRKGNRSEDLKVFKIVLDKNGIKRVFSS